jgi:hypothetical protein
MATQELAFQLSESGEQIVRTYECTKLTRWLLPDTIGYLTVTNKRIVFHSSGRSFTGKSLLINEMPIEDVTGISVYQGLSINWPVFIILSVVAFIATQVIGGMLPPFLTSYTFAILIMLPFILLWLVTSSVVSESFRDQAIQSVENATQGRVRIERDLRVYLPYTRIPLYVGIIILIWRLTAERVLGIGGSLAGSLVLMIIYGVAFFLLFGRQQTFSLAIGSKTKKDSGIYIPGDTFRFFASRDTTAVEALSAHPAADAGQVVKELGAMLMDIQQLGDMGIQKWKR